MKEEIILKFDEKNLFNKDILHQYDEDGQKGFLGYLLRKNSWRISNNQIVFPDIKSNEKIKNLLKDYDTDIKKNNLIIKKDTLDKVMVLGFSRVKDFVDNEKVRKLNVEKITQKN